MDHVRIHRLPLEYPTAKFPLEMCFSSPTFWEQSLWSLLVHAFGAPALAWPLREAQPSLDLHWCVHPLHTVFWRKTQKVLRAKENPFTGYLLILCKIKTTQWSSELVLLTAIFDECMVMFASLHSHLPLLLPEMHTTHYPKKLLLSYIPAMVIALLTDTDSDSHPYIRPRTTGQTST